MREEGGSQSVRRQRANTSATDADSLADPDRRGRPPSERA
jgi:hypothetical protein